MITKIASNKNCSKLNFLQKTQWTHIPISPLCEARERQTFTIFKYMYYNVLKWETKFTFDFIEKASNKNCIKSNFLQMLSGCIYLSPPVVELVGSKDLPFLKYNALQWGWQIFGIFNSNTGGDRHMCPVRFL